MSPARAIAYGLPGLATLFTFTMFTTYGLYFFTNVVGLSGKFAGLIMTIGTLWDAVTDPLVGIISDNRDPRKGRRRPFLLVCAIPFGIVTWLLFTAWDFVEIQQKIYFIIVALLFYTFQTLIDVPYTSLSGEVTDNYDLRSKLRYNKNVLGDHRSGNRRRDHGIYRFFRACCRRQQTSLVRMFCIFRHYLYA